MTDTPAEIIGIPEMSTKALLEQALEIIVATFWTRATEFNFGMPSKLNAYEGHYKKVEVLGSSGINESHMQTEDDKVYGYVTSACSIGALALARSLAYAKPLDSFCNIVGYDHYSEAAGMALATCILADDEERVGEVSFIDTITGWNDDSDTSKEDVVRVFENAINSPLATSTQIWRVSGDYSPAYYFPTKEAAAQFITEWKAAAATHDNGEEVTAFWASWLDSYADPVYMSYNNVKAGDPPIEKDYEPQLVLTLPEPVPA